MFQKDFLGGILLLLLFNFFGCSHLGNHSLTNEQLIERGTNSYRQNIWEKAILDFNEVLKRDPLNSTAHFKIGVIYHKKGQIEDAINKYQRTLMIDPFYSKAYFNLALIYYKNKNNIEKALDYFDKYLKLEPTSKERFKIFELAESQKKEKSNSNNIK